MIILTLFPIIYKNIIYLNPNNRTPIKNGLKQHKVVNPENKPKRMDQDPSRKWDVDSPEHKKAAARAKSV